jgi:UDPglucose--hexose-1-phosphate uridylyltransferase
MSELRQDLTSGDWVLLSPERAVRPKFLDEKKTPRTPTPIEECPFEDIRHSANWPPVFIYLNVEKWILAVIPNKYPALERGEACSVPFTYGMYHLRTAVGSHRLLVTRDHNKHFVDLSPAMAVKVFETTKEMHVRAAEDPCLAYISSFYNYGRAAGASVWHPHYQLITLPLVPPHTVHSLAGAKEYFKKHRRCVRCDIIATERKAKIRIIEESAHAIAIAPYASKRQFEVNVLPKKHWASFRDTPPAVVREIALTLQSVMKKMKKQLNDPDLNFFIHDTPFDGRDYRHHHWHIEVTPRVSIDAGFEFSTGIAINAIDPDNAAAILNGKTIKKKK